MRQYFKVLKGSDTFNNIQNLFARINKTNKEIAGFAESLGAIEGGTMTSGFHAAGGVIGFLMETQPENWKKAPTKYHRGYYFPKAGAKNKELHEKIHALPKISRSEYNTVINMPVMHFSPGLALYDDYILIQVPLKWVGTYEPFPDMIEITVSEYMKLDVKIENSQTV